VIERCVLLARSEQFPEQWLQLPNLTPTPSVTQATADGILLPLDGSLSLDDMERYILQQVLDKCDHNVSAAAKMLGTTRETLRYRVRKYDL
jgi:transcriptional regulator with GAF, ATPase, and Fis domain